MSNNLAAIMRVLGQSRLARLRNEEDENESSSVDQ